MRYLAVTCLLGLCTVGNAHAAPALSENEAHQLFVSLARAQVCGVNRSKDFNEAQLTAMETYLRNQTSAIPTEKKDLWLTEASKLSSVQEVDDDTCDVLFARSRLFYPESVMAATVSSTNRPPQQVTAQNLPVQQLPPSSSEALNGDKMKSLSEQTLAQDNYWVVVGSRQNVDDAISIAREYGREAAQVVASVNGWFAVVEGPKKVSQGAGKAFLESLAKSGSAPKDAYLTRGVGLTDIVWSPAPPPILQTLQYDGKASSEMTQSGIRVLADKTTPDPDGQSSPFVTGFQNGKKLFVLKADQNPSEDPSATVYAMWLDKTSSAPQFVYTYYWHGAHCCTVTRIGYAKSGGTWSVANGEDLDGDGYDFEDINRDGSIQLVSSDNSFLYAFDSYADSVAPLKIQSFKDGVLSDATKLPSYQHRLWQRLFTIERYHQENGSDTISNGYLAGWVASKILVGQGSDAWQSMLQRYDHQPNMGPEVCLTGASMTNCPADKTAKVPFPVALRGFLLEHGYIDDASQYPIPVEDTKFVMPEASQHDPEPSPPAQPAAPAISSNMQTCAGSSETVRTIVYQMYAGRKMLPSENDAMVTLEDDTTVEAADTGIGKVVCAVTYDLSLKRLIGQLAEVGDMRRANMLSILARRGGAEVSKRIKYSVKPTAQGSSFVEVLR